MTYQRFNDYTFDEEITLVKKGEVIHDEYGNAEYEEVKTVIFCDVKGVDRNQFFNASTAGYKLSYTFVINEFEFSNEDEVIYLDKEYQIIRAYPLGGELLEITVGERLGGSDNVQLA